MGETISIKVKTKDIFETSPLKVTTKDMGETPSLKVKTKDAGETPSKRKRTTKDEPLQEMNTSTGKIEAFSLECPFDDDPRDLF